MRSHLLEGKVRHRRARPFVYALEHDVYYVALDLDELDEVPRRVRFVSRNRPIVLAFRDGDHLDPPAVDLREAVREHLRTEGVDPDGWRITLITNLRVFGYVFNPASFYLCRDASGELQVVIVEVHNTHHERHLYTLRRPTDRPDFAASMDKDFYVSPFIEMVGRLHGPGSGRAGAPADLDQREPGRGTPPAHESRSHAPAPDRPHCRPDAGPAPAHHPEDDRSHPLARLAPLATRRPFLRHGAAAR